MRPRGVLQRFPQRARPAALLEQIRERLLGKIVDRPLRFPRQGFEGVPRLRSEVDASRHTNTIPAMCEDADNTRRSQNGDTGEWFRVRRIECARHRQRELPEKHKT
jgi:hypothetical protein